MIQLSYNEDLDGYYDTDKKKLNLNLFFHVKIVIFSDG